MMTSPLSIIGNAWKGVRTYLDYHYGRKRPRMCCLNDCLQHIGSNPSNATALEVDSNSPPEYSPWDPNISTQDHITQEQIDLLPSHPKRNRAGWPRENIDLNWPFKTHIPPNTSIYWTIDRAGETRKTAARHRLIECEEESHQFRKEMKRFTISRKYTWHEKTKLWFQFNIMLEYYTDFFDQYTREYAEPVLTGQACTSHGSWKCFCVPFQYGRKRPGRILDLRKGLFSHLDWAAHTESPCEVHWVRGCWCYIYLADGEEWVIDVKKDRAQRLAESGGTISECAVCKKEWPSGRF